MAKKYFRMAEIPDFCSVSEEVVFYLEREDLIKPVILRSGKVYPLDQVDRIRATHILIGEMGVNLEGVEVASICALQIVILGGGKKWVCQISSGFSL